MSKLTLLIADGNRSECSAFEQLCASLPEIELLPCAYTGDDALECLRTHHVDMLLIDPVLPGLDGLGVLDAIWEMNDIHRPAIFVCSSLLEDRLLYKFQQKGVVYCFIKPINEVRVMSRMLELMSLPTPESLRDYATHSQQALEIPSTRYDNEQMEITQQIRAVGIPAHLKGYHYLRYAIYIAVKSDKSSQMLITKEIYPKVAEKFKTKSALVERAIRNAIEVAWTRGNTDVLHEYFGYTINDKKGKPTNAEFVAMIADRVKMRMH